MKKVLVFLLSFTGILTAKISSVEEQIRVETEHTSLDPIFETLLKDGYFEARGKDAEIRTPFVTLQGIVEKFLAKELGKSIRSLEGIIHTPMPATPLCSEKGATPRAGIIRGYLEEGANLYIVYPNSGFSKRSLSEQEIYKKALSEYSEHLFDRPIQLESIPLHLIGATYSFKDLEGRQFIFSIKMTQANDPQENANYALWFGPSDHPEIQKRIVELKTLLPSSVIWD